jgi:biopolymer transport protein ExbD
MRLQPLESEDAPSTDDGQGVFVDLLFILLVAMLVILAHFANKDVDHRFAVAHGPGPGIQQFDEEDYARQVVVSMDAQRQLRVNGKPVQQAELRSILESVLPEDSKQVIYDAAPSVLHGDADRVQLLLMSYGFTVLKEYEEINNDDV